MHTSYHQYIGSKKWNKKRRKAKARANNRCEVCDRSGEDPQQHPHDVILISGCSLFVIGSVIAVFIMIRMFGSIALAIFGLLFASPAYEVRQQRTTETSEGTKP